MKSISKEILNYMHKIQDLVVETEDVNIYYQADIYLFNVYALNYNSEGYKYHKQVYIDGFLSSKKQIIEDLKQIIEDLEEMKNANRSKSKFIG